METHEIELAKLTDSDKKVNTLLNLKKITIDDLADLGNGERRYLAEAATKILAELNGE